jgi:hypothetical protein
VNEPSDFQLPHSPPAADATVTSKETSTVTSHGKLPPVESSVLGVSIRAWIASLIVITVCYMCIMGKEVPEPLYGAFMLSLGYYYGSAAIKKTGS